MLTITGGGSHARALRTPIDLRLKRLVIKRRDQLGGDFGGQARFVIVQPGDSLAALEAELNFSVFQHPGDGTRLVDPDFTHRWQWIEDHGHCFELVFIMTDDGFAHLVIVQNLQGVDLALLKLCRLYVTDPV